VAQVAAKPAVKAAISHFGKFLEHCMEHRYGMGFTAVGTYLAAFMAANQGSTASLTNVLSYLRTQHAQRCLPFLTVPEEVQLKHVVKVWKRQDRRRRNRKDPLRFATVKRIVEAMDLRQVHQLQQATLLLLGTQALMRTKEITDGLRGSDVIWHRSSRTVTITVPEPTKTCEDGFGVQITLSDTTEQISAYKFLERLFAARRLDQRLSDFVFCQIHKSTLSPKVKASDSSVRQLIKRSVAALGLDPTRYSGHSMRAGGATDMFAAGLPYYVIKKYGRWASDAALVYFRSEASIAVSAASAFVTAT